MKFQKEKLHNICNLYNSIINNLENIFFEKNKLSMKIFYIYLCKIILNPHDFTILCYMIYIMIDFLKIYFLFLFFFYINNTYVKKLHSLINDVSMSHCQRMSVR